MRTFTCFLTATAATLGLICPAAIAEEAQPAKTLTKIESGESGPAFKLMFNPAGPGYLGGGYGVNYIGKHGYFGGAGFGGRLANGGAGFGGILVGGRGDLGDYFGWQAEMLMGGGGGSAGSGGFIFAEPTLGLVYKLGDKMNFRIYGGYFLTPESQMMGPTTGATLSWKWQHGKLD